MAATRTSNSRTNEHHTREARLRTVRVTRHAWQRGFERHSPAPLALAAVVRNLDVVRRVCTVKGDRAAVDYQHGIAVVERQRRDPDRFAIVTIRATSMGPGKLPVILDGIRESTSGPSGIRRSTASIGAILESRGIPIPVVSGI